MYTGTSKAVPVAQTDFDCDTWSDVIAASEPAQTVEPVRKVLTPAPEPDGSYEIFASGCLSAKPAIQASTALCCDDAPAPANSPDIEAAAEVEAELDDVALVLSPQAARAANMAKPEIAATERINALLRIYSFLYHP